MTRTDRYRVLLVCPECDPDDVGESQCAYEWVAHLAERCDVTLLTARWPEQRAPSILFPDLRVIEWDTVPFLSRPSRFNSAVKPWYPLFYLHARSWLRDATRQGKNFDLLHQISPIAMRFPSPCSGFGIPYIIGPVGGGLPTPSGFARELATEPLFARLRNLDDWRLRHDPWLRRTYEDAALVLCSAPYAKEKLSHLRVRQFRIETEVGIVDLAPSRAQSVRTVGQLRMLHVGRTVRTKGLRDAVRALARLSDFPGITLDVAGAGEDLDECRKEAEALGVDRRIRFLGRVPPQEVDRLYQEADLFLFPSFREPTGIVLFEAMRHGLPVITTDIGGPGHIVTDDCGIRVPADNPDQFARDLANAIKRIALDPALLGVLGQGARARVTEIGLWDNKVERIMQVYKETIERAGS